MRKFLALLLAALLLPACAGASGFLRTVSEPIPQEEQQELNNKITELESRLTTLNEDNESLRQDLANAAAQAR